MGSLYPSLNYIAAISGGARIILIIIEFVTGLNDYIKLLDMQSPLHHQNRHWS